MKTIYERLDALSEEDLLAILEASRIALGDDSIRDYVGAEMDVSDEMLNMLTARLDKILNA